MISHSSNLTGGGEDDFFRLIKYFSEKYYIVSVIPEGPRAEQFVKYSNEYLIIRDIIFPFLGFNIKKYINYLRISFLKIFKLIPFFKKHKDCKICFVNSSVCMLEVILLDLLNIPFVISIKEKIEPGFVRKIYYKYLNRNAKKIIVISDFLKNEFENEVSSKKISKIYSTIEEEYYLEIKQNTVLVKKDDIYEIVCIGNIYPLKNQKLLVEAVSKSKYVNKIRIKFIGKVLDKKYYEHMLLKINEVKDNEIIFEFTGEKNKEEVIKQILNTFCIVITSKQEGMSIVLLESLFLEKPVVTTNVGIVPEIIINEYNGIILKNDSPQELANAIDELIDNNNLYVKIKENCLNTFLKNFKLEKYLKEHENVLFS